MLPKYSEAMDEKRCETCKYFDPDIGYSGQPLKTGVCGSKNSTYHYCHKDDFCDYHEPKENTHGKEV